MHDLQRVPLERMRKLRRILSSWHGRRWMSGRAWCLAKLCKNTWKMSTTINSRSAAHLRSSRTHTPLHAYKCFLCSCQEYLMWDVHVPASYQFIHVFVHFQTLQQPWLPSNARLYYSDLKACEYLHYQEDWCTIDRGMSRQMACAAQKCYLCRANGGLLHIVAA